jgi:hypothetical protein
MNNKLYYYLILKSLLNCFIHFYILHFYIIHFYNLINYNSQVIIMIFKNNLSVMNLMNPYHYHYYYQFNFTTSYYFIRLKLIYFFHL